METASVSLRRNQWQGQPTILWFFFHWVHKWWPTINRALLKHQVTDDKGKSVQGGKTSQSLCSEVNTVPDDPFFIRNTEIVSVGKLYDILKHRCDSRGAEATGQGSGFSREEQKLPGAEPQFPGRQETWLLKWSGQETRFLKQPRHEQAEASSRCKGGRILWFPPPRRLWFNWFWF